MLLSIVQVFTKSLLLLGIGDCFICPKGIFAKKENVQFHLCHSGIYWFGWTVLSNSIKLVVTAPIWPAIFDYTSLTKQPLDSHFLSLFDNGTARNFVTFLMRWLHSAGLRVEHGDQRGFTDLWGARTEENVFLWSAGLYVFKGLNRGGQRWGRAQNSYLVTRNW